METRIGYDHNRKKYTFNTSGEYYKPLSSTEKIFVGEWSKFAAAIFYTKLVHDIGYRDGMRWGTPCLIPYDNGIVGYQCGQYYKTIEEAKKDFEGYSQLSPKVGCIAYVDVWLAVNNKKTKEI